MPFVSARATCKMTCIDHKSVGGLHSNCYWSKLKSAWTRNCNISSFILIVRLLVATLSQPYTRQLLSPATRQHYCSCVLHMKYWMLHSTSCLKVDSPSISKRLVECTMRCFHAQHTRTIMLPCRRRQKLPHVRMVGFTCRDDWISKWRLHSVGPTSMGLSSLGQNIIH